jgi:hypothetical protein
VLLYRDGAGDPIATLLTLADRAAVIVAAPSGHVDFQGPGACLAAQKVTCRVGAVHLPFEVCEDRFYRPGLLAALTTGETSYTDPDTTGRSLGCPPRVQE